MQRPVVHVKRQGENVIRFRIEWLFVVTLALCPLTAPPAAQAQPTLGKTARIGYLSLRSGPSNFDEAFRQGLRELGYVEGQNISIEYRWADLKPDRIRALAEELVRLKVDVIVTAGGTVALAVKRAVRTIPVVFIAGDPVRAGLVANLARPGGNLTGINVFSPELNVKRLELLKTAKALGLTIPPSVLLRADQIIE